MDGQKAGGRGRPPERRNERRQQAVTRASAPQTPSAAHGQNRQLERLMRIERRKARNRAITLSILVMAIMLITVLLIIAVMQQAKPSPSLVFIQNGELVHTLQSTGLIIRDEAVYPAPSSGLLKTLVTEGARAARGQKLAMIIPAAKESQLAELQQCENEIISLQTQLMNAGKVTGAQAVFDESAASLNSVVNLIRADISKGSLTNLSAYSASIAVILEQRTAQLVNIDFDDARIDTLTAKKASLESSLGLDAGTLICQKSGIVSFDLDGLEAVLLPDSAATISAAEYQAQIAAAAASRTKQDMVENGDPVLRITSNLYQYLVFLLPDTDPTLFKADDLISVSVPGDGLTIANCRCIRSEASGRDALVVFRTDNKVERLADRRTISAELAISRTTGLKVPVSALIDFDADLRQARLMIVSNGYTRTCLVNVLDQDREYAIIEAVATEEYQPRVSTVLVANPSSIEAGEFIGN